MTACSYYFPAVLTVYGPHKWGDLYKILLHLIKNKNRVFNIHNLLIIIQ